jgi:hypothetical protein
VATGYGGRSTGEVEDEVSRYYEWYDIDRIFLDQKSASTDHVGYYEELYEYVKDQSGRSSSSSSIVVTSAGVPVPQACMHISIPQRSSLSMRTLHSTVMTCRTG